ncbi:MAG: hypothetical protein BECKG1743D_GA0114223_101897 [Candidatus Kentron sp. G]|nr:MAG: hypothetical protein BECKG1743D_GA0114223_101897 [Candidatus Kentron sp. G]
MSILSKFLTKLGVQDDFCIQLKEYTKLLVFIVQLLRCNNRRIVNDITGVSFRWGRVSRASDSINGFG